MDRGYIAGSLFKQADQRQRVYEKEKLTELFGNEIFFFNPLTDNPSNDKSKLPTAQGIFNGDTEEIIMSNHIIAELDGEDAGVMMELGIAWGINFMRDNLIRLMYHQVKSDGNLWEMLDNLLEQIPHKEVYAHLSDLRVSTSGEYDGVHVPFGYNQYVVGGVEQMGKIYPSFEDIMVDLARKLEMETVVKYCPQYEYEGGKGEK